ncbi:MAG: DUF2628 domain-containing protein [Xanthobacteraceae bacterium]
MSVYTVHAPPERFAGQLREAERVVFVRDAFSFWAFVLAPLWMLWHRMWIVLAGYIVVMAALVTPMVLFGVSATAIALVGFFIALFVGLEAGTFRRLTLRFRDWRNVGVVSGDDVEEAERRFFGVWLQRTPAKSGTASPPPLPPSAPSAPSAPQIPGVVGLFPEPGVRR